MLVLFDTEFSDLVYNPTLLSIGLVTFDGGLECYAELDLTKRDGQQRAAKSSDFVKDEVLPQWGLVPSSAEPTEAAMGVKVSNFLNALVKVGGEPIHLAYDYQEDARLLTKMLRNTRTWDALQPWLRLVNIGGLTATGEFVNAQEAYFESLSRNGIHRHHALADARAMRVGFAAAKDAALTLRMSSTREGEDRG